jgi:CRISPR-associated protein Cmr1
LCSIIAKTALEREKQMQEEIYPLEIVSPLMLGGQDNQTAELRSPPFRGAMRYWLRATLGAILDQAKDIRQLENEVFGSAGEKASQGSAITIRLKQNNSLQPSQTSILPHKSNSTKRNAFCQGQFQLILSAPRPVCNEIWLAAQMSLNLALTFGGVGLRARRGYGTLRITNQFPTNLQEWQDHIKNSQTNT